jgi:hypothetical protein
VTTTAEGTLEVVITNGEVVVGLVIVTPVLAFAVLCAALLAVTMIGLAPLVVGAVNNPPEEIVPALVDQVTAVLLVLLTAAAN